MFGSESDVPRMVERLPGLHQEGDFPYANWLEPSEMPVATEIEHNVWVFPVSRASFSAYPADGVIYAAWNEVQFFVEAPSTPGSYSAGSMSVNDYTFGMADGVEQVHAQEKLLEETK